MYMRFLSFFTEVLTQSTTEQTVPFVSLSNISIYSHHTALEDSFCFCSSYMFNIFCALTAAGCHPPTLESIYYSQVVNHVL